MLEIRELIIQARVTAEEPGKPGSEQSWRDPSERMIEVIARRVVELMRERELERLQ
ncbi:MULTISPECIES: DUF5908 family protein [unclassified Caballeronia]|uniref:DUF5908 family protein n=1 Tax=unclassified Caballeronia TaxID=2646786 RepID=UPI002855C6BE|nr:MULTISPECIES: DUF5908 family protein [unclassified Caballeronia]MDR5816424.1 DUF5908 family protein [Caballeronia sp. LZ033]MDR5823093.1 DUF5908 family protein [Caballeronia sp. LZ043]MDR5881222.1 DUF5908 family protein [Caballeronia sp. LZ032]